MLIQEFIHHPNAIGKVMKYKVGWYFKHGILEFGNYQIRKGKLKRPTQCYQIKEEYNIPNGDTNCMVHSFDSKLTNLLIFSVNNNKLYVFNIHTKEWQTIFNSSLPITWLNMVRIDDDTLLIRDSNGQTDNAAFYYKLFSISQNRIIETHTQYGDDLVGNCCNSRDFIATGLDTENKIIYFIGRGSYNGDYRIEKLHYNTGQIERIYSIPNSNAMDTTFFVQIKDTFYYTINYNFQTFYKYPQQSIYKYATVSSSPFGGLTENEYLFAYYGWGHYCNYMYILDWNTYKVDNYILLDKNGNRIQNFGFRNNNNGNGLDSESCLWAIIENWDVTKLVRICPK